MSDEVQPLSAAELAAIHRATNEATPGPWHADGHDVTAHGILDVRWIPPGGNYEYTEQAYADAAFIAGAREWVPRLLATVETFARALVAMSPCRNGDDWECPFCHCLENVNSWSLSAPGTPHTKDCPVELAHTLLGDR